MDILERLGNISIFSSVRKRKDVLKQIAGIMKHEDFRKGRIIIREGESGGKMYILNAGSVRVERKTLANDNFTVVNLKDSQNVFFGEISLMDNDIRSASIIATTDVECYTISKTDFDRFCSAHPEIGYLILKDLARSLAGKLRKANQDSVNLIDALVNIDTD